MTIVVRPARLADALGIAAVHHAAVQAALPDDSDKTLRDNWAPPVGLARAERLYREAQEDGQLCVVAEIDGDIAGFGLAHAARGDITACYVAPSAARRGIGRALCRTLEGAALASGSAELTVRASLNAESFYRALGFSPTARGQSSFDDGTTMPVVFMRKPLTR